ncbi:MAG: hypothetical protein R3E12_08605 [Candidatus Eisenbacteria bacterium]
MAVGNDLFLKAPLSFLALALSIPLLRGPRSRIETFLTIAAGGCLVAAVVFNPEIGPYRDWDASRRMLSSRRLGGNDRNADSPPNC